MIRASALIPLLAALAACSSTPPPAPAATAPAAVPAPRERAQAAAKEFSTTLKAALSAQMAQGGTVAAIGFCHDEAPRIAAQVAATHGVRLGRVAIDGRTRNPANAASAWQAEGLAAFKAQVAAGTPPAELVRVAEAGLPDGVAVRMMRGIAVEPVCLACHGKALSPETATALRRHYPDDAATGFDAGDLRGALWVEVPDAP